MKRKYWKLPARRCQVCGHPIPPARLAVLPHTYHCVVCSDEPAHRHEVDGPDPSDLARQVSHPERDRT